MIIVRKIRDELNQPVASRACSLSLINLQGSVFMLLMFHIIKIPNDCSQAAAKDPLCKRFQLKDFLPQVMSRLAKYPLIVASIIKCTNSEYPFFYQEL